MAPRKPDAPTLTREQIVDAAVGLVDRDGLDALTMRRLAGELGVGPMTLYYHVKDKSALYDLILDAVMSGIDFSVDDPALPPGERVIRMAGAFRAALLAHPQATVIAMARSLRTPTQLRPLEAMLGALLDAGLSPGDSMRAANVIGQFVIGTTTMYANHIARSAYHDDGPMDIDPAAFPNLMIGLSAAEEGGWEVDFNTGLRALVEGLVVRPLRNHAR